MVNNGSISRGICYGNLLLQDWLSGHSIAFTKGSLSRSLSTSLIVQLISIDCSSDSTLNGYFNV